MRILTIDDDLTSLKLITSILRKNDYTVTPKTSGKEALAFFKSGESVDLVISDVIMPEIDGFALLRVMKADARLRDVPVILCTALKDNESVIKGIKLGVAGYITKPIDPKTLLTKVKSVAQTHQTSVLIVGDQQLPRELLAKIISRGGYSTIMAGSGAEALRLLGENRVGVIVAETMMSPMSGLELLATAKDRYPHTPLVLMANKGGPQEKKDLLNAGADGYLAKPLNNTEIMELIKPFLN